MYPTEKFDIEKSDMDTTYETRQILKELEKAGIQHSGVMLDILMADIDILAEAVKLKNERFACTALERLMSFCGFQGTPVENWCKFGDAIHTLVTVKEMHDIEFRENIFVMDFGTKVIQHPYRTAMVGDTILLIDRLSEEGKKFEEKLAKEANARTDNHTVYTITMPNSKQFYVSCSDFKIRIGMTIEMRNW